MSIIDLEKALIEAKEHCKTAAKALAPKHKGGEMEAYHAAHAALMSAERELSEAKGEQYAIPLGFPVKWDVGAPLPHLFVNDYRAYLAFYVAEPDPNWDGSYVNAVDPRSGTIELLALVEFKLCLCAKLGSPNDEVLHGHPLSGHGQDCYTAQLVKNSPWLAEIEAINKVHRCYDPKNWKQWNHYIFWFHDTTFECIAKSYTVETFRESMKDMLVRIVDRMTS